MTCSGIPASRIDPTCPQPLIVPRRPPRALAIVIPFRHSVARTCAASWGDAPLPGQCPVGQPAAASPVHDAGRQADIDNLE